LVTSAAMRRLEIISELWSRVLRASPDARIKVEGP
jgi:hypothetical protein